MRKLFQQGFGIYFWKNIWKGSIVHRKSTREENNILIRRDKRDSSSFNQFSLNSNLDRISFEIERLQQTRLVPQFPPMFFYIILVELDSHDWHYSTLSDMFRSSIDIILQFYNVAGPQFPPPLLLPHPLLVHTGPLIPLTNSQRCYHL